MKEIKITKIYGSNLKKLTKSKGLIKKVYGYIV